MERVIDIDDSGGFGILTGPDGPAMGPAVVLFNAGLTHRSGPQRFHVELARRLALRGFTVFRFDMPGVGDAAMEQAMTPRDAVARVFDVLQRVAGVDGFVVGGTCSAADLGWRTAVADPRVRGLLLIDPMAVRGRWYRIGRLQMALRSPVSTWSGKLLRFLRPAGAATDAAGAARPAVGDYRDWPTPGEFQAQAAALLHRGVRILALYTGGVADYLLHPRQIDETCGAVRRHPGLQIVFRPDLDHILFAQRHRREVADLIDRWLQDAFAAA
jgi:pimeloyl-ACP methyl ester carboxylesterase